MAAAGALVAGLVFAQTAGSASKEDGQAAKLRNAITVQGIKQHEQELQNIASANGGTRASGTPGYEESVAYVVGKLQAAGYAPEVQTFDFAFFQELSTPTLERVSPDPKVYVAGTSADFATMTYSGSGDVTAQVQEVNDNQFPPGPTPSSSNAGCEDADFAGLQRETSP